MTTENYLRKTQAAMIIANSLHYSPLPGETPSETIAAALESAPNLSKEQEEIVREMVRLAEEVVGNDDGYSDDDLEAFANSIKDFEDIADAYEPGELHIVDDETGEHVDNLDDELKEETLNEVLSRIERIRAKMRFHKTEAKRERKLKIALKKRSSSAQINNRARKMAIKTLKMKLARKPLDQMTVAEKERIEALVAKRKKLVDRLAMKMTHRVRQIEKDRLTHKSTQAA